MPLFEVNCQWADQESEYCNHPPSTFMISTEFRNEIIYISIFSPEQLLFNYKCQISQFHWRSNLQLQQNISHTFQDLYPKLISIFGQLSKSNQNAMADGMLSVDLVLVPAGKLHLRVWEQHQLSGKPVQLFNISHFSLNPLYDIQSHLKQSLQNCRRLYNETQTRLTTMLKAVETKQPNILIPALLATNSSAATFTSIDNNNWTRTFRDLERLNGNIATDRHSDPLISPAVMKRLFPEEYNTTANSESSVVYSRQFIGVDGRPLINVRLTKDCRLEVCVNDEYYCTQRPVEIALESWMANGNPSELLAAIFKRCSDRWYPLTAKSNVAIKQSGSGVNLLFRVEMTENAVTRVEVIECGEWSSSVVCSTNAFKQISSYALTQRLQKEYSLLKQKLEQTERQTGELLKLVRKKSPALLVYLVNRSIIKENSNNSSLYSALLYKPKQSN